VKDTWTCHAADTMGGERKGEEEYRSSNHTRFHLTMWRSPVLSSIQRDFTRSNFSYRAYNSDAQVECNRHVKSQGSVQIILDRYTMQPNNRSSTGSNGPIISGHSGQQQVPSPPRHIHEIDREFSSPCHDTAGFFAWLTLFWT